MAARDEILAHADALLDVGRWPEFGPPGAQVLGARDVDKLVCGVSSSLGLFRRASAAGAQMVVVHHGLFWRNEPLVVDRRQRGRLEALFAADLTLAAYHLALDAHPELGNSAQLAKRLGMAVTGPFEAVGVAAELADPIPVEELVSRTAELVQRRPLLLEGGPERVRRVAVSTGAAGHSLIAAARLGFDLLLTGEPEEPSLHAARELGIHLLAAGHYATERFGVQALCAYLAERFDLAWEFVDVPNPV